MSRRGAECWAAGCWANKVVVRITAIVHGCHMLDTVWGGRRGGGGGMSDAYQVLMRRFRAAAPAAATPPTGYTHFTPLTQTLSWEMGRQVLVLKHSLIQPNTKNFLYEDKRGSK